MFIKICGLSAPDAIATAVDAGADALGFVFAASPRRVSPDQARVLCQNLDDRIVRVAVMRHPSAAEWEEVRDVFAPHWLQTDAEDFAQLDLGDCMALPVFRTGANSATQQWPGRLLYEGTNSGSGEIANWGDAAVIAAKTQMILAGGLDSDNVETAITAVKPWGVDVSSGVESTRGTKDLEKINEFIARARATE